MSNSRGAKTPSNENEALEPFQIPGRANWYHIGFGESRVTLYTQQVRGLNLAWALRGARRLEKGARCIVVGGGAAGLSVAAGLAHLGQQVTVLEKESDLLPLQRHCHKRHLHPHIFDWPDDIAARTTADVPLLRWRAGMARDVAESIELGFEELATSSRLDKRTRVQNLEIDSPKDGQLTFRERLEDRTETRTTLDYGTLIFALGFGVERSFWAGERGSYWADDSLDQHGVFPPGRYLISGVGDGGLIDLLRIQLRNFRQDELARLVEACPDFPKMRDRIRLIEHEAQDLYTQVHRKDGSEAAHKQVGIKLFDDYQRLDWPTLNTSLRKQLNGDARVTLISRTSSPFSLSARPLHRLLFSQLYFFQSPQIDVRSNVELKKTMLRHTGYEVTFNHGNEEIFAHAVIRHGATSPTKQFPLLHEALLRKSKGCSDHEGGAMRPLYGETFGVARSVAGSGSPRASDYLDELGMKTSTVIDANGLIVPIDTFADVFVEVRERTDLPPIMTPRVA